MKKALKEKSRTLRKNQTDAEKHLWYRIRSRQIANSKFRRQHTIGNYIVDFVCLEKNLILELDGSQHFEQQEYDNRRSQYLKTQDFTVLRFWNHEVLQETNSVLEAIFQHLSSPSPLPSPSRERVKETANPGNIHHTILSSLREER